MTLWHSPCPDSSVHTLLSVPFLLLVWVSWDPGRDGQTEDAPRAGWGAGSFGAQSEFICSKVSLFASRFSLIYGPQETFLKPWKGPAFQELSMPAPERAFLLPSAPEGVKSALVAAECAQLSTEPWRAGLSPVAVDVIESDGHSTGSARQAVPHPCYGAEQSAAPACRTQAAAGGSRDPLNSLTPAVRGVLATGTIPLHLLGFIRAQRAPQKDL